MDKRQERKLELVLLGPVHSCPCHVHFSPLSSLSIGGLLLLFLVNSSKFFNILSY